MSLFSFDSPIALSIGLVQIRGNFFNQELYGPPTSSS